MLYNTIKWLHILAAILALGANATYGIWLARVRGNPDALAFTLKTIKLLDDRLANPAYGASLVTGLLLVWLGPFTLTTPWLDAALVLYAAAILLGLLGYSPLLRAQIRAAETAGPESAEYQALSRRGTVMGIVLAVMLVAIEILMTTKPQLWG